eukprot:jgi/Psemu1/288517/fgenesh1_pg.267_\
MASQVRTDGNSDGNSDGSEATPRSEQDLTLTLPFPVPFPGDGDESDRDHNKNNNNRSCDDENDVAVTDDESPWKRFRIEQGQKHSGTNMRKTDGTLASSQSSDNDDDDDDKAKLDRLPPDVFVLLCCNLTVGDIASLAACSKALCVVSFDRDVWRQKFLARWNYDDPTIVDWCFAYRQAYANPHDLWITHWNCVDPCDGLAPGRCCIQEQQQQQDDDDEEEKHRERQQRTTHGKTERISPNKTRVHERDKPAGSSVANHRRCEHRCPNCRYHPCLEIGNNSDRDTAKATETQTQTPISISTTAQAVRAATNLRLEESSHFLPCTAYSPNVARRAFTKASTLHRSLDHRQYRANSLFFLEDLLFFHVHDEHDLMITDDEPLEMKDWKDYVRKRTKHNDNAHRGNDGGVARANDGIRDHNRDQDHHPLRDCEESEPALHSWHLANVCNPNHDRPIVWRISVQRPECFTVFPSEGYLLPGESKVVTFGVTPLGSLMARATQQLNVHREATDEFWLMEFYPVEWQRLQALQLEEQCNTSIFAAVYRTESPCMQCGLTWGPRMEELGQAFVLAKLECEATHRRHLEGIRSIYRILVCLVKQHQEQRQNHCWIEPQRWTDRNQQVVKYLHRKVMSYRGTPWLNRKESQVLLQWEFLLDVLSRSLSSVETCMEAKESCPLPYGELYRYPTCTDSVFNQNAAFDHDLSLLLIDRKMISWKSEPSNLRTFSCLAHSPGRFNLPREDYNSFEADDKPDPLSLTQRQYRKTTDMFLDCHFAGFKAALSVFADPRSLLAHGLFDKVPYPGRVFRRCKLPVLSKLNAGRCMDKIRRRYQNTIGSFIASPTQLAYYELQESLDVQGLLIVNLLCSTACDLNVVPYPISVRNFIRNIPFPGNGRFALSAGKCDGAQRENLLDSGEFWYLKTRHSEVRELIFEGKTDFPSSSNKIRRDQKTEQRWSLQESFPPLGDGFGLQDAAGINNAILPHGPRILNILWMLSSQLGWTVDNNERTNSVYVDRRILIAAHWLSITLAFFPLLVTLLARYFQYIPATPTSYHLDGLPYNVDNKMRFLTENECLYSSVILLLFYCMLGRWVERYTGRDLLRTMKELSSVAKKRTILYQMYSRILHGGERAWDAVCPSVLQRILYQAHWNRRNLSELMKYVSFWRSRECKERRSTFGAVGGRGGIFFEERDETLKLTDDCARKKILAGITIVLVGFSFGSPHFAMNFLTVFPCSVGLGASTSLQSIEAGRSRVNQSSSGSFIESFSLVTIVMFGLLIGQLVGGSGGVLFLVEFAITSMSLLLGGMGTISASGMETWGTFFCLSTTAFWGYLFGRCSVLENILKKKAGQSSMIMCISLYIVLSLLLILSTGFNWENVVAIVVRRPLLWQPLETQSDALRHKPNGLP